MIAAYLTDQLHGSSLLTSIKKIEENQKPYVQTRAIIRDGDHKHGVHMNPCVVPQKCFLEKILHLINLEAYTQICVGLLQSLFMAPDKKKINNERNR